MFKKKQQPIEVETFEQERKINFNKMISEFNIGNICYCNGYDSISGIFMNANEGIVRAFDKDSLMCDIYLIKENETVRIPPELIFHTKKEAIEERRLYKIKRQAENIETIKKLKGTTISKYINRYGLQSAALSFMSPPFTDLEKHTYQAIEVIFGNNDHFIHAFFTCANLTKKNNLEDFEKQFQQYCIERGYPIDCILSVSVLDASDDLKKIQELVEYENELKGYEKSSKEEESKERD